MYKSFKDMPIWQEAMDIAEGIFNLTESFPKKEDYGLTSQLRRAALSISANIAEAYGRNHTSDKVNFYYFARGSAVEVSSHIEYAKRVGYFTEEQFNKFDGYLIKMYNDLNKIIVSLKK
ncbi:MAG TPA: four helix bundle protein [Candidatus Omnitrophota bacterium]|jgi:four helix bundle protein|nr:four helix bundle protein [Candidatus Omnitrophota bacterium]